MAPTPVPENDWPTAVRWALWATILGIALYVVLDVVAQLLPPHYSPISQAESDLGVGPYGWVMNVNFLLRGALSLAFVYALYRAWPSGNRPRAGLVLIAAWAVGAFVLAVNPADVSGPATVHGTIHLVTAFLAFFFVAVGALLVSFDMPAGWPWGEIRPAAKVLVILSFAALLLLFLGSGIPRIESHYFGLLERVFLGLALLWMLVVSLQLLRLGPVPRSGASAPG